MLRSLGKLLKYFGFGALCMGLAVVAVTPWISDPLATLGRGPAAPDAVDTGQPGYVPSFGAPDLEILAVIVERPLRIEGADALAMLRQLSEEDRDVLTLRFVDELEPREIAEVLGISANAASVRIHRAMKRLRERIDEKQDQKHE